MEAGEQEFDDEAFSLLTEEDIKQLIPKMGHRLKFMKLYREKFLKVTPTDSYSCKVDLSDVESLFSSSTVTSDPELWSEERSIVTPSPADTIILPDTPASLQHISHTIDLTEFCEEKGPSNSNKDQSCCTQARVADESQPSSSCSWVNTSTPGSQLSHKPSMFDVRKILSVDKSGQDLMKRLDKAQRCVKSDKRKLCNILASHIITQNGYKPPSFIKAEMAQSIIKAFPYLADPDGITGYESFYCKGSKNSGPASGPLEDRINYLRRIQNAAQYPSELKSGIKRSAPEGEEELSAKQQEIEIPSRQLEWLKAHTWKEDPKQVEDYMTQTANYRRNWMQTQANCTMKEILTEFPHLLDPGMIEKDFSLIYPEATERFYGNWPELCLDLNSYATFTQKDDPYHGKSLSGLSPDEKHNAAIHLLPHLFPGRRKGGRFSVKESCEAFVDFHCESTDLEFYLQNISERPQPYVLILGGNKLEPQQTFVIIERNALPQRTLMKAVDVCFKSFYVFDLEYQKACIGVWEFFQKVVYELPGSVKCHQIRDFRAFRATCKDVTKV